MLFTLGMLAVYRVGSIITVPGVNLGALDELARQLQGNMFGLYDMFSGGNLSKVTIFALGIMPYISASIILQLLTVVWPYLEKLSKEGELGRRKITQYTRYGTIVLSVVQALGIAIFLERQTNIAGGLPLVINPGLAFRLMTVLTLTTGTVLHHVAGRADHRARHRQRHVAHHLRRHRRRAAERGDAARSSRCAPGQIGLIQILFLLVFMALVIAAIVFVERGHRRVTVQYAKRVVGRRMYGGSSTHIPLKVNTGGVIPVIFASSILAFPATIAQAFPGPWADEVNKQLGFGMPLYNLLYVVGIIFFAYFYTAIIFNPDDVAENMRKYGGFVPGIRPGKRTAEYIDTILTRITLAGAVYLALIAIIPNFLISGFRVAPIPFIGESLDAALPKFITQGLDVHVLLRRHVAADRRRRRDGYRAAGRVAADHAALRRLHEEDADPGTTSVKRTRVATFEFGFRRQAEHGAESDHARPAGRRQGHAGRAVRAEPRDPEDLDRRHPAGGGAGGNDDRAAGEGDHGSRRAGERRRDDRDRAGAAGAPRCDRRVRPRRVSADGGAGAGARRS